MTETLHVVWHKQKYNEIKNNNTFVLYSKKEKNDKKLLKISLHVSH